MFSKHKSVAEQEKQNNTSSPIPHQFSPLPCHYDVIPPSQAALYKKQLSAWEARIFSCSYQYMPCIAIEHSCGPRLNNLEIRVAGSGKNVEYYKVKSYLGHIKNLTLCVM